MADALISPAVGGAAWVAAAALTAHCARRVRTGLDERATALMGVLGAFVFAAQMINFAIPLTGSSGHLGGGLLLAILLGPHAAFLVMASILTVQALFFADGGLLALGCNLLNLGFIPCFIGYFIYSAIRTSQSAFRIVVAAVIALQLGAFGVVCETAASGRAAIPFGVFALFMQPIHLAIGLVEGLVTAAVVAFVFRARPELRELSRSRPRILPAMPFRRVLAGFAFAALLTAGVLSWWASSHPDGLEWSLSRAAQNSKPTVVEATPKTNHASVINPAASASGLLGSGLTLGLIACCGLVLRRRP